VVRKWGDGDDGRTETETDKPVVNNVDGSDKTKAIITKMPKNKKGGGGRRQVLNHPRPPTVDLLYSVC
jgi:phage major head subunit gpT-like protein